MSCKKKKKKKKKKRNNIHQLEQILRLKNLLK